VICQTCMFSCKLAKNLLLLKDNCMLIAIGIFLVKQKPVIVAQLNNVTQIMLEVHLHVYKKKTFLPRHRKYARIKRHATENSPTRPNNGSCKQRELRKRFWVSKQSFFSFWHNRLNQVEFNFLTDIDFEITTELGTWSFPSTTG